ncbi:MAG: LPP20 family lipoprotein [Dissulfurispiraceae bacterium]
MAKAIRLVLALLGVAGLLTGCASTKVVEKVTETTPIQDLKAPEWVSKGSGAFSGQQVKVFYGVGSAAGMKNPSMLRMASEDRARVALAKEIQVYTASLQKDYMDSMTTGSGNATSDKQLVESAIKTVTAMTLRGAQIVDHWQNPATGELFSLARVDLELFKNNLDQTKEIDPNVKENIRKSTDRMNEQLKQEEAKTKGQQ